MLELQGIAVSPGVAIGKVLILDREGYRITRSQIDSADRHNELDRLRTAIAEASKRLEQHRRDSTEKIGVDIGAIFSAHQQLLLDTTLHREWERLISDSCYSAEFAVSTVLSRYAHAFRNMGSDVMAERAGDIRDVERTLLEALGGAPLQVSGGLGQSILLSHDLTPAETAGLDRSKIIGFCTEAGGPGGHTAIVARGMELPAVVGLGSFLHRIARETTVILDGFSGRVVLQPDEAALKDYRQRMEVRAGRVKQLTEIRDLPAVTQDGTRVTLLANIEFPGEIAASLQRGAEGIGLYRTEFLYLGADTEPSEEEQTTAYREVLSQVDGLSVIMRTLDLGADKVGKFTLLEPESNPSLGLRSIRLSLRQPRMLRTQLRAMVRAACGGKLKIMFPMISTLHELRTARMLLRQVIDELAEEGHQPPQKIQVGMMVEVPAAVLMLERFVREVDFISIGTNDLIQYTMAADRSNEYVADLYAGHDPAVLRLLQTSVDVAQAAGVEISVCGEMSSNPITSLLLVGLGVRILSASPASLPQMKQALRQVRLEDCTQIAKRVFDFDTAREVDAYLKTRFAELLPEMALGV
ncbi:MAG: phosphoenolpyruvate--protein phosphotransferase [Pirellulaceae bacterium]|jgi:phosphotransferase system enzyme I (PtsI)|nr:phosphoenolpyruvate--protein phosphotransferase [Pirellulaceae bacterium]